MYDWEDYYKELQVHYTAEPEVIESAYKRLAKKYHPDINRNEASETIMKKINKAYEVLKDPDRRRQYHLEWVKRFNECQNVHKTEADTSSVNQKSELLARAVLIKYFDNLLNRNFEKAYDFITDNDKKSISKEDFIKWQSTVAKVFKLKEFDCRACKVNMNRQYNCTTYKEAVDFRVVVVEYNAVMDRLEKDELIKTVVLKDGIWRIFLGYDGLQPLISKFEGLTDLIAAKSVINELVETHSKIDSLTGLFNKKGFVEMAEREAYRYNRYGNVFSLAVCEADNFISISGTEGQEAKESAIKWIGETIQNNIRKLDIVGRWWDTTFVILLPQTTVGGGINAIEKIQKLFEKDKFLYNKTSYKITMNFGVVEYCSQTVEECIKTAICYANIGKKLGGNKIVSKEGIEATN